MSEVEAQKKMLNCTINGTPLQVKEGTTIIQAMYDNHQKIAHYCWHPGLSIAGVCRLCMVEIEGNPRVQIACNTTVTEGMKVNNTSAKVKEAVKWGLDFHLINHPLDCPICDQAGECGLQDQYMEFGQYNSEMAEPKTKKHKVVDLGPTIVLDSERCILCSRCVRFTDEVTKTHELGIFNRGDHAEIGTHSGKELNNKYSLNTVDICPVGALTSKDFRFRQRVWYLKDDNTICNGCSTGCNTKVYFNKEGLFRVKPRYNAEVNGHWMCDEGRNTYKFVNREFRMTKGYQYQNGAWGNEALAGATAQQAAATLAKAQGDSVALVLTGQNSVEEYTTIVGTFVDHFKTKNIFHWWPQEAQAQEFDGLLLRGDKNPNTKGLQQVLQAHGISTKWSELESQLNSGKIKNLIVVGPENIAVYNDIENKMQLFSKADNLIYLTSAKTPSLENAKNLKSAFVIPLKTYIEKDGTFINYKGLAQKFKKVTTIVSEALTVTEAAEMLAGQHLKIEPVPMVDLMVKEHERTDKVKMDHRKKNEFIFQRGPL